MTQTDQLQGLFAVLVEHTLNERISQRIIVEVCYQQKLFIAEPRGTRVLIRFGRQAFGHPSLMQLIEEAGTAAEALLYGLSTAVCIRLDEDQRNAYEERLRWIEWEQRQREQGERLMKGHYHDHACECEHADHFPSEAGDPPKLHGYGQVEATKKIGGHMDVCQLCYDTCLKDYR